MSVNYAQASFNTNSNIVNNSYIQQSQAGSYYKAKENFSTISKPKTAYPGLTDAAERFANAIYDELKKDDENSDITFADIAKFVLNNSPENMETLFGQEADI